MEPLAHHQQSGKSGVRKTKATHIANRLTRGPSDHNTIRATRNPHWKSCNSKHATRYLDFETYESHLETYCNSKHVIRNLHFETCECRLEILQLEDRMGNLATRKMESEPCNSNLAKMKFEIRRNGPPRNGARTNKHKQALHACTLRSSGRSALPLPREGVASSRCGWSSPVCAAGGWATFPVCTAGLGFSVVAPAAAWLAPTAAWPPVGPELLAWPGGCRVAPIKSLVGS